MRNCPEAFLLHFPYGKIHILSSPKLKGHPIYSRPFWKLTYSQYLYRSTLSLAISQDYLENFSSVQFSPMKE